MVDLDLQPAYKEICPCSPCCHFSYGQVPPVSLLYPFSYPWKTLHHRKIPLSLTNGLRQEPCPLLCLRQQRRKVKPLLAVMSVRVHTPCPVFKDSYKQSSGLLQSSSQFMPTSSFHQNLEWPVFTEMGGLVGSLLFRQTRSSNHQNLDLQRGISFSVLPGF